MDRNDNPKSLMTTNDNDNDDNVLVLLAKKIAIIWWCVIKVLTLQIITNDKSLYGRIGKTAIYQFR